MCSPSERFTPFASDVFARHVMQTSSFQADLNTFWHENPEGVLDTDPSNEPQWKTIHKVRTHLVKGCHRATAFIHCWNRYDDSDDTLMTIYLVSVHITPSDA